MKEILSTIAKKYGTPVYVYFEKEIKNRIKNVMEVFEDINLIPTFALKANNNPALIKIMYESRFGADIVTVGEYKGAEIAGVPKEKIVWNGNGKSKEDMDFLKDKIKYVNIDSFEEMELWKNIKTENVDFFLRVNPDVDAKTHPHISTGLKKNKFGIPAVKLEEFMNKYNDNRIKGIHFHIGSQITEVLPFIDAFKIGLQISKKYNLKKINIGGGWGINYDGKELNLKEYKEKVIPLLKYYDEVLLELGRYIMGPSGILLLNITRVKKGIDKVFVVTNGGMNLLIRPVLYSAYHEPVFLNPSDKKSKIDIVGPLCESGDKLLWNKELYIPEKNSLVYFKNAGAYGFSMSNNYNSTLKPAEVLVTEKEEIKLIRKRESYEDLYKNIIL